MQKRYFITSPGRTGTTLLATIMSDAGADFGMKPHPDCIGSMEMPAMHRACYLLSRAGQRPPLGIALAEWGWRRARARWLLKRALRSADYFKLMVPSIARMIEQAGYKPVIILNTRRFGPTIASFAKTKGGVYGFTDTARRYTETFLDGAMLLDRYGGCVVDYDDIVEKAEWADDLAKCTGLDADELLRSRDRRCAGWKVSTASFPVSDVAAERVYEAIRARA